MLCSRPLCEEQENRVDGFCSIYCRDVDDLETEVSQLELRKQNAEAMLKLALEELARHDVSGQCALDVPRSLGGHPTNHGPSLLQQEIEGFPRLTDLDEEPDDSLSVEQHSEYRRLTE